MRFLSLLVMACAGVLTTACTDDVGIARSAITTVCESWEADSAPHTIWPPNHKMVRLTLDDCVTITESECLPPDPGPDIAPPPPDPTPDPGPVIDPPPPDPGLDKPTHLFAASTPVPEVRLTITSITSNEPIDVGHGGDGHTAQFDARIIDDTHFELRAERQGGGHGRTYTVNFVDQDGVAGFCTYVVPHDKNSCSH